MPQTTDEIVRDYVKQNFPTLTPQEQEDVLKELPSAQQLAGLSADQIRDRLDRMLAKGPDGPG